jgi:hypothetical protein
VYIPTSFSYPYTQAVFQALFDPENTPESESRDRIRREILANFLSVRVWLFDAPSDSVSALRTKLTYDKTCQRFREQLTSFRNALSIQLKEPTTFAGAPCMIYI